jgi:hypothetical protein
MRPLCDDRMLGDRHQPPGGARRSLSSSCHTAHWSATRHAHGRAIPREPPSHVGSRPGVEPDGPVVRRGGAIDKALLL